MGELPGKDERISYLAWKEKRCSGGVLAAGGVWQILIILLQSRARLGIEQTSPSMKFVTHVQ